MQGQIYGRIFHLRMAHHSHVLHRAYIVAALKVAGSLKSSTLASNEHWHGSAAGFWHASEPDSSPVALPARHIELLAAADVNECAL